MTIKKSCSGISMTLDVKKACISSLIIANKERLAGEVPIFRVGLRDPKGELRVITAFDAQECEQTSDGARYFAFPDTDGFSVRIRLDSSEDELAWYIELENQCAEILAEWVDFPLLSLPRLKKNNLSGDGGEILFPYNEGAIVSDDLRRNISSISRHLDPVYPSIGRYAIFPNMVSSQMLAYLWDDVGLYIGAHDSARSLKGIDFYLENDANTLQFRLFCGTDFGESFRTDYPIVWAVTGPNWESAAQRYRTWFESALPKISRNGTRIRLSSFPIPCAACTIWTR